MSVAAAIRKMIESGLSVEQALMAAEAMEAEMSGGHRGHGDDAMERRRAWDRERKRKARASAKSGGHPVESGGNPQSPVDTADASRALAGSNNLLPSGDNKNPPTEGKKTTGVVHALPINSAFDAWDAMAGTAGLPKVRDRSDKRVRQLRSVLGAHGEQGWQEALAVIARSSFLTGKNDRGWRATFDFVVTPGNFAKILEGTYAKPGDRPAPPRPEAETREVWAKRLTYARQAECWWPEDWGPWPGTDGCRAPADMLRAGDGRGWRERRRAS